MMNRIANVKQQRSKERKVASQKAQRQSEEIAPARVEAVTLPVDEPSIKMGVPKSEVESVEEISSVVEIASETTPDVTSETIPIPSLEEQLKQANDEIARLKQAIFRSTRDGLSITIPVPSINSTGILDTSQYEIVKTLYSGIVLDMIETTYKQLEARNKQVFSFYTIEDADKKKEEDGSEGSGKEIRMTFAVVSDGHVNEV